MAGGRAAELHAAQLNRGRAQSIGTAGSDGEDGTSPSASESARDVGSGECTHSPAGFGAEPHSPCAEFALLKLTFNPEHVSSEMP